MTREEHLKWSKQRALEYLEKGDLLNAFTSLGSDLQKYPETKCSNTLMYLGMLYVKEQDAVGLRRWIEGFN